MQNLNFIQGLKTHPDSSNQNSGCRSKGRHKETMEQQCYCESETAQNRHPKLISKLGLLRDWTPSFYFSIQTKLTRTYILSRKPYGYQRPKDIWKLRYPALKDKCSIKVKKNKKWCLELGEQIQNRAIFWMSKNHPSWEKFVLL